MDQSLPERADATRASDKDRSRVAELLAAALTEGRLDESEYTERLATLYRTKTLGELAQLTRDLPPPPAQETAAAPVNLALLSKVWRSVHGRLPAKARAAARFGVLMLDVSGADFSEGQATVDVSAFCGKMVISVPENARVVDVGQAFLSKRVVPQGEPPSSGGPIIRLEGRSILSKVTVRRRGQGGLPIEVQSRQRW